MNNLVIMLIMLYILEDSKILNLHIIIITKILENKYLL
jgi:hypothetical protein